MNGEQHVHAGCWSDAERYFSEAVQLNPQDPMATAIMARIDELFCHRRRSPPPSTQPGGTAYSASATIATAAACDPEADRSDTLHCTAWRRASQGLQRHAYPVE